MLLAPVRGYVCGASRQVAACECRSPFDGSDEGLADNGAHGPGAQMCGELFYLLHCHPPCIEIILPRKDTFGYYLFFRLHMILSHLVTWQRSGT